MQFCSWPQDKGKQGKKIADALAAVGSRQDAAANGALCKCPREVATIICLLVSALLGRQAARSAVAVAPAVAAQHRHQAGRCRWDPLGCALEHPRPQQAHWPLPARQPRRHRRWRRHHHQVRNQEECRSARAGCERGTLHLAHQSQRPQRRHQHRQLARMPLHRWRPRQPR